MVWMLGCWDVGMFEVMFTFNFKLLIFNFLGFNGGWAGPSIRLLGNHSGALISWSPSVPTCLSGCIEAGMYRGEGRLLFVVVFIPRYETG